MGELTNPPTQNRQFDSPDVPSDPTTLRAGDSWNWERIFPDYPSALYQLKLILNNPTERFVVDGTVSSGSPITAADDSQGFVIQVPASSTGSCAAGIYQLVAVLIGITGTTAEGQQVTLPLQDVLVAPNLAGASAPVDTRSTAKKNLDAIEACLLGNVDPSVNEYTINGRMLRRFSRAELLKEREYWKAEYRNELRAQGLYVSNRTIGFRFV